MANNLSQYDGQQVLRDVHDINNHAAQIINLSSLIPNSYDYIALTYVASGNGAGEIETATYKQGGASGTAIATLTLSYDASNRLASVTRS